MKQKLAALAYDVLAVAGAASFVYGLALAWRPAGFMAGGIALMIGAYILGSRRT